MTDATKHHPRLAVLLSCVDWRLHQADVDLNARIGAYFRADGVDVLTVPGPDGLLRPERAGEWAATVGQMRLLIDVHAPVAIAAVGHQRCAGHAVADDAHDRDVAALARALKAATGFSGPIHAMMLVYRSDTEWDLKSVAVI
jgi:hypothetical protein